MAVELSENISIPSGVCRVFLEFYVEISVEVSELQMTYERSIENTESMNSVTKNEESLPL